MSKLIFCKFLDTQGNPRGADYTYRSDIEVAAGDFVEVETMNQCGDVLRKKVIVTNPNVNPDEIKGYESFKDRIKAINGKWQENNGADSCSPEYQEEINNG